MLSETLEKKTNSKWSVGKEVVGTFLGVLPFVIMLIIWGSNVERRLGVIESLDQVKAEVLRDQRTELLVKLDRLSQQVAELQTSVAKLQR